MKISIREKLLLAFAAILLLLSIVWLMDYLEDAHLASDVSRIYTHPLAVTRAYEITLLKKNGDPLPAIFNTNTKYDEAARQIMTLFLDDLNVEIIEADPPHLIISDIDMPVMNGFALLEEIKGDEKMRSIPIIVATADSLVDTRMKVLRLGANDFISKPFQKEELVPRIRKFIT